MKCFIYCLKLTEKTQHTAAHKFPLCIAAPSLPCRIAPLSPSNLSKNTHKDGGKNVSSLLNKEKK
jgi:hypothetical protein